MFAKQKASSAAAEAAGAHKDGQTVFVYRVNIRSAALGASGPLTDVAAVIQEVESAAWRYQEMTFENSRDNKVGAVILLFRRL